MPSEEELLTRQMPHSTEAEQSVLGSMLIDARCVPEVIEALRPEDFYLRTNREIYETIYSMFNFSLTIDPVTVLEHMKQNGVYDENTSRNYILQLMEITPTAANVKEYVAIVKDKALLRRIAETAGELTAMVQEGTGTAQEVLEAAEQRIYAIRQGGPPRVWPTSPASSSMCTSGSTSWPPATRRYPACPPACPTWIWPSRG